MKGFYADNLGRVWREKNNKMRLYNTYIDSNGYQRISVYKDKKVQNFYVQRLVCEAFKGQPDNIKPICLRSAPNQQPRRVRKNKYLKWGTSKQIKRDNPGCRKLNLLTANQIRKAYNLNNITQKMLANKYNVSQSHISLIVNNRILINK